MNDNRKAILLDIIVALPNQTNLPVEFSQAFLEKAFSIEDNYAFSDAVKYHIMTGMIYGAWQGSKNNGLTATLYTEYSQLLREAYILVNSARRIDIKREN